MGNEFDDITKGSCNVCKNMKNGAEGLTVAIAVKGAPAKGRGIKMQIPNIFKIPCSWDMKRPRY